MLTQYITYKKGPLRDNIKQINVYLDSLHEIANMMAEQGRGERNNLHWEVVSGVLIDDIDTIKKRIAELGVE